MKYIFETDDNEKKTSSWKSAFIWIIANMLREVEYFTFISKYYLLYLLIGFKIENACMMINFRDQDWVGLGLRRSLIASQAVVIDLSQGTKKVIFGENSTDKHCNITVFENKPRKVEQSVYSYIIPSDGTGTDSAKCCEKEIWQVYLDLIKWKQKTWKLEALSVIWWSGTLP